MRASEFVTERKKKKSSRSTGGYFFPGYGYYGASDSGEGGGDGGGESVNRNMAERKQSPLEDFEGLQFRMVNDNDQLFVNAFDSSGGNELGHVTFDIGDGKELDPQNLYVKDKFRSQGIARLMYDFVKSKGYKIQRSWDQTDAGAGFWDKHRGEERVWEQGVAEGLTEYKNTPLQDYNGLQFMIDSNHPYLRVKAFAPGSGQQLAQVDFKIDDQDELHPEDLHVEERWRGQGIAKVMYDYVKSQGYTIHRSWSQTDAGSEFWNKHRGQKRVWEQGVAEGKQPGQPVVDAILKVMPIAQEIWFHGSRATRSHRKNSDTDILVIVPDDLVGDQYLGAVRILQKLSTHFDNYDIQPTKAKTNIHRIAQEEGQLLWSNKQAVAENFADGKNPQDKGDSKRHGINTKASVSSLRKTAKQGGRKGQLAHWLANMKSGRAKKKKTNETVIGTLHFPKLIIAVDDHAIDRTRTRGISPATIDQSLRKLNGIADQLGQMESSNTVWVYDVSNNLALGLRRTSSRDMQFTLKTVVADRPYDGTTPIIELTS